MPRKARFTESGCIGCQSHMEYGLTRYCAGFKNKNRRKMFRKRDPACKAPKWCPKRKDPCEYRIYSYADMRAKVLAQLLEPDDFRDTSLAIISAHRYKLRDKGTTKLSPKKFYECANDLETEVLLNGTIQIGDVVEIDTGLAQFFFYCACPHHFLPAFFDPRCIKKNA